MKSLIKGQPIIKEVVINIQSIGLDSFVSHRWIVATLKLLVVIIRPKEGIIKSIMLDTRAKANIMSYGLTKDLGCLILSTEHLKLKTVSRQVL